MCIHDSRDGFYGKTIITLTKAYYSDKASPSLPAQCKLSIGDDVALYKNNKMIQEGVVYKRHQGKLKVSINEEIEDRAS